MSRSFFDMAVQSYCFRRCKENAVLAGQIVLLGLNRVELCSVHADFTRPDDFPGVVATYRAAGVEIVSLGVQKFTGDPAEKSVFECAAAAGAKHISGQLTVDTFTRAIPLVQRWCREFDIRVGLHCHGGFSFGGQPEVLDHLLGLGGPEIGLCLDTAWAMQLGPRHGNPVEWVKRFAGRITAVHFKDFVFDPSAQWKDVLVGEGNLNLPAFLHALEEAGFDGVPILEYEADPDDPLPALTQCVRCMRECAGEASHL